MVTENDFSLVGSQKQIVLCVRKCNMCHVSEVRSGGARLDAFAGKSEGFHVATLIGIKKKFEQTKLELQVKGPRSSQLPNRKKDMI